MTHYLHAKWLLRDRLLDGALEAAKRSYEIRKEADTLKLLNLIMEEKKNKGKMKVKVTE